MRANDTQPDWIEIKTAELLRKAQRSGYFQDVINDAKWLQKDGYVWDVALAIACEYWCR